MAECVLFDVAEGIIGKLRSLTFKEIELLWVVKDELEKLKNTVSQSKSQPRTMKRSFQSIRFPQFL
jgi:hypothetical protein